MLISNTSEDRYLLNYALKKRLSFCYTTQNGFYFYHKHEETQNALYTYRYFFLFLSLNRDGLLMGNMNKVIVEIIFFFFHCVKHSLISHHFKKSFMEKKNVFVSKRIIFFRRSSMKKYELVFTIKFKSLNKPRYIQTWKIWTNQNCCHTDLNKITRK